MDIKVGLSKVPTFEEEVECSLSDIRDNIQGFYDDFSQGGWKGWVETTQPRNNLYGAYLLAKAEEISAAEREAKEREKELEMGEGFLSPKNCTWYDKNRRVVEEQHDVWGTPSMPVACRTVQPANPNNPGVTVGGFQGPCDYSCAILTPASTVEHTANKTVTNFFDQINAQIAAATAKAGPYAVYIQAIVTALINRVTQEGTGLLEPIEPFYVPKKGDKGEGDKIPDIISPEQVLQRIDRANILIEELTNLKESLERLLIEQQTNLPLWEDLLRRIQDLLPLVEDVLATCAGTPCGDWARDQRKAIRQNNIPNFEKQIANLEDAIPETIEAIGLADTAIASTQEFIDQANNWLEVWERVAGDPDDPELEAATIAMEEAKDQAIEDIRAVVRLTKGSVLDGGLGVLVQEVRKANRKIIERWVDQEAKRGDPRGPAGGTIYRKLENAEIRRERAETCLSSGCLILN